MNTMTGTVYIDITEKSGPFWTIVGTCPESLAPSGGLRIYRDAYSVVVRDTESDAVIIKGRGLAAVLQSLATESGMTVVLDDETRPSVPAVVYAPQPVHADGTVDGRYSVTVEFTGAAVTATGLKPGQAYVARFRDEWLAGHATAAEAWRTATRHARTRIIAATWTAGRGDIEAGLQ